MTKTMLNSGAAFLLLPLAVACSSNGGNEVTQLVAPTVRSNSPIDHATGVPINTNVNATFSERMDSSTLTQTTFTLTKGTPATPVLGTVVYSDEKVVFWPSAHLEDNTLYSATISRGARNFFGIALATPHVWSFTTGDTLEPGRTVELGRAGNFAILAKTGISTVPTSAITGDVGISPAAASFITGFALAADPSNVFATSAQVIGNVYAADYAPPTPANMTTTVLDMQTAFADAAGRAPDVTDLGAGNLGGLTITPGVYKWGTGLLIPADVTLNGSDADVWIFQIAQDLEVASGAKVLLTGGANARNIFWQVTGLVDLGTTAIFEGNILSAAAITLHTDATVNGRLLAQTAVNLDRNIIVKPQ